MYNSHLPAVVGRADIMERIAESLCDPERCGAVVMAPAGLGKTAVLRAVTAAFAAEFDFHCTSARTTAALGVPYHALAPFLEDLPAGANASPVDVLRCVTGFLSTHLRLSQQQAYEYTAIRALRADSARGAGQGAARGRQAVVVVDDTDELDPASAAVVTQLATGGAARVLLFSRPGRMEGTELMSLWSEGLLERFDLGPLAPGHVHELCGNALGGTVLPGSSAVLGAASGGNPRILLALIEESRRLDRLVQRNGVWLLVDAPPERCPRLAELARDELARLHPQEREAAFVLALAGSMKLSALRRLADGPAIAGLAAAGLISVDPGPAGADPAVQLTGVLQAGSVRQLAPLGLALEYGIDPCRPAGPAGVPHLPYQGAPETPLQIRDALSLLRDQDLAAAAVRLAELEAASVPSLVIFGGTLAFLRALIDFRRGFIRETLAQLVPAVEGLRHADPEHLLPYAAAVAADAAALLGDRDAVAHYSAVFADLSAELDAGPREHSLLACAHVAAASAVFEGASAALAGLARVADQLARTGPVRAEAEVIGLLLRLGDSGRVDRLAEITRGCEGTELRLAHDHALALQERSGDALVRVAEAAEAAGYLLLAAEAAASGVRCLARDGDFVRRRNGMKLLQRLLERLPDVVTAQLNETHARKELTHRERDVAALVASGAGSREIAARLRVSLRTVEGHIYRIYEKLGVSTRSELAAAYLARTPAPDGTAVPG